MSAANLINMIRKEVLKIFRNEFTGFELATVVSSYPALSVRIDNMKVSLGGSNLVVCERLLRSTRIVSLKSRPGTVRELGDKTEEDKNRMSNSQDGFLKVDSEIEFSHVQLEFQDVLKVGDRVLVQAVPGGQKYMIIDRVVDYA